MISHYACSCRGEILASPRNYNRHPWTTNLLGYTGGHWSFGLIQYQEDLRQWPISVIDMTLLLVSANFSRKAPVCPLVQFWFLSSSNFSMKFDNNYPSSNLSMKFWSKLSSNLSMKFGNSVRSDFSMKFAKKLKSNLS